MRTANKMLLWVPERKNKKIENLGIDSKILFQSIVKKYDARIFAETKLVQWMAHENWITDLRLRRNVGKLSTSRAIGYENGLFPRSWLKEMFCNMEKKKIKKTRYTFDFTKATDKGQIPVRLFNYSWCRRRGAARSLTMRYQFGLNWLMNNVGLYAASVELWTWWEQRVSERVTTTKTLC